MSAKVLPMKKPATWDDVAAAWEKTKRKGFDAVLAAAEVGAMLIELKENKQETPYGAFVEKARRVAGLSERHVQELMSLARHRVLIEAKRPESQRAALALIPKKQLTKEQRIARQERFERKREKEEARPKREEEYRSEFFARAWNARQWAQLGFSGKKVDQDMIDEARAAAIEWEKIAAQLERMRK